MPSSPELVEWIGYAAAVLTTCSFVPQAVLTLRTRDVSGISSSMYASFTLGVGLWFVYGLSLGAWPIILANAVTLALASTILITKLVVQRAGKDVERR
ncbi:MAG: SemiSWEET transporter [Rubrivivax sp.]|jgi:MtN3 and saliva related transmembrane protein